MNNKVMFWYGILWSKNHKEFNFINPMVSWGNGNAQVGLHILCFYLIVNWKYKTK